MRFTVAEAHVPISFSSPSRMRVCKPTPPTCGGRSRVVVICESSWVLRFYSSVAAFAKSSHMYRCSLSTASMQPIEEESFGMDLRM